MRLNWSTTDPEERRLRTAVIVKSLFIAVLTALIFLLAQSMISHRFFRGGSNTENNSLNPERQ
ncbi:MAG TPA: hypothetical protein VHZ52_11445 [Acidobacteriaceae bacterium]|nr:hypothetical protein [Acidobacteriaceae bacterium]